MNTQVIHLPSPGGADALRVARIDPAPPAAGEVRIRQLAVGVNYVDVYQRTGYYPLPGFPAVLGVEAAGVVEALGAGVDDLAVGDRVAYFAPPCGAYAGARNLAAGWVMRLPDTVAIEQAAGAMLRGITAHMLFTRVHPVGPDQTVLVHAAAGGLGLILVQWARALGARVIGTVGSEAKAELAREHGLEAAIHYREQDFVARTLELTDGRGADLVIDGVGGQTLLRSLAAAAPFGTVASIGQTAGAAPSIAVDELGPARSVALARPSAFRYARDGADYRAAARATLDRLAGGLRVHVGARLPLAQAAQAHRHLERGTYPGALLLIPED